MLTIPFSSDLLIELYDAYILGWGGKGDHKLHLKQISGGGDHKRHSQTDLGGECSRNN